MGKRHCMKRGNCFHSLLLLAQCFLLFPKECSVFFITFTLTSCICNALTSLKFCCLAQSERVLYAKKQNFNSFLNKPWFLHICSTSLLKTLWEKEKLLVTSNFYTPVEDRTYYGITRGGRAASSSLSGAYLQNYST